MAEMVKYLSLKGRNTYVEEQSYHILLVIGPAYDLWCTFPLHVCTFPGSSFLREMEHKIWRGLYVFVCESPYALPGGWFRYHMF